MKYSKRTIITLDQVMQAAFWLCLIRGVIKVMQRFAAIYLLLTDPTTLQGTMGLTIDWLILEAQNGFGVDLNTGVGMNLVQLFCGAAITVTGCLCIRSLRRILQPIERNQPFRTGISAELHRLSRYCFALAVAENAEYLLCMLLIETGYHLEQLLLTGPITDVRLNAHVRPAWFFVSAVVAILSMVFRRGEELQQLSDETL